MESPLHSCILLVLKKKKKCGGWLPYRPSSCGWILTCVTVEIVTEKIKKPEKEKFRSDMWSVVTGNVNGHSTHVACSCGTGELYF